MNKLCVLSTNPETYFMKRLREEVGQGLQIITPQSPVPETDHILVRTTGIEREDKDLSFLSRMSPQTQVHNSFPVLKLFRSKNDQYRFFSTYEIPILPWRDLTHGVLPYDCEELLSLSNKYLVKPRRGQGGWGVKVLTKDELSLWWAEQLLRKDTDYVLQPYVNDAQEFRVFFCSDYRFTLTREAQIGVAANFTCGGKASKAELPSEFKSQIEKLISISGAEYGAIDILLRRDHMYVLELNSVPGIEQAESLSGDNLIREILNKIVG